MSKKQYKINKYYGNIKQKHLDQLLDIEKKEFNYSKFNELSFIDYAKNKDSFYIFIEDKENNIIGYMLYYDLKYEYEIYRIYISNKYRHNKLGSKLLSYISDKNIFLEVSSKNQAQLFYEKNNFKKISIRYKYYNDKSDAIIYKKEK